MIQIAISVYRTLARLSLLSVFCAVTVRSQIELDAALTLVTIADGVSIRSRPHKQTAAGKRNQRETYR
jgi:hypothetical protein